jgi:hypothetical protein
MSLDEVEEMVKFMKKSLSMHLNVDKVLHVAEELELTPNILAYYKNAFVAANIANPFVE